MPWSRLQPLLTHDGIEDLIALHEVLAGVPAAGQTVAEPRGSGCCREKLLLPPESSIRRRCCPATT